MCTILSAVATAFLSLTCKMAYFSNLNLNGFDYMLVRCIAMVMASSIPIWTNRINPLDIKGKFRLPFAGILIVNVFTMPCFFVALKFIPTTKASISMNMTPIFISILGVLILKEIMTKYEAACTFGAFTGVILLATSKGDVGVDTTYYLQSIGMLMCLGTAVGSSFTAIFLRDFNKECSYLLYPFYYAFSLLVLSVLLLLVYPSVYDIGHYTPYEISLFMISGVLNILANALQGYALKLQDASTVAPFLYVNPLIVFLFDLFLFKYSFGVLGIFGCGVTVFFLLTKLFVATNQNKAIEQNKLINNK